MRNKIKVALIGYGKMGKEIDALCKESKDFEVVSIGYRDENDKLDLEGIKASDVAIDFTSKDVVLKNIEAVAKLGKNIVVGTTGWSKDLDKVKKIIAKNKVGLIYGANFSIGANIFLKTVEFSAKFFSKYPQYDVYGLEIHHKAKLDSPSGTALKIASKVKGLEFTSIRSGQNPGFHEVVFGSGSDSINLSHQAHNRSGFAKGSLVAAEFIKNKKGIYSFEDLFK